MEEDGRYMEDNNNNNNNNNNCLKSNIQKVQWTMWFCGVTYMEDTWSKMEDTWSKVEDTWRKMEDTWRIHIYYCNKLYKICSQMNAMNII